MPFLLKGCSARLYGWACETPATQHKYNWRSAPRFNLEGQDLAALTSSAARLQPPSYRLTTPHLGVSPGINLSASYVKIKSFVEKEYLDSLFFGAGFDCCRWNVGDSFAFLVPYVSSLVLAMVFFFFFFFFPHKEHKLMGEKWCGSEKTSVWKKGSF